MSEFSKAAADAVKVQFVPRGTEVRVFHAVDWEHQLPSSYLLAQGPSAARAVMDARASMVREAEAYVTRVADELVEKGWVERCPCGEDRRQVYLRLTKAGYAFLEPLLPTQRERHRRLWASFTKADMQTMEGLLRKLLTQLGG